MRSDTGPRPGARCDLGVADVILQTDLGYLALALHVQQQPRKPGYLRLINVGIVYECICSALIPDVQNKRIYLPGIERLQSCTTAVSSVREINGLIIRSSN